MSKPPSPYLLGQIILTALRAGYSLAEVVSGAATRRQRFKGDPQGGGEIPITPEENTDASLATAKAHIRHLQELCDHLPDDVDMFPNLKG